MQSCYLLTFQSQAPIHRHPLYSNPRSFAASTTLQSLLEAVLFTSSYLYLFYLTPSTVPAFDVPILWHITVSGFDSTLVAHSRLLPSLIARKPAISQHRLGITIQVHKTESPTRRWANTAIHFNKDVPSGNQGKMIEKKDLIRWGDLKWSEWREKKTSGTAVIASVYAHVTLFLSGMVDWHGLVCVVVGF